MGFYQLENFAISELAAGINDSATTLSVKAGEGALFPASGDFMIVVCVAATHSSGESNHEIMKCTARSTDTLTIVRAQEGTSAVAHAAAELVALRVTKGVGEQMQAARTATRVVAASDAPADMKAQADYVCDGTADDVEIQAAIAAANGGLVQLSQGMFHLASSVSLISHTTLRGVGRGTRLLNKTTAAPAVVISGGLGSEVYDVLVEELTIEGATVGTTHCFSATYAINLWLSNLIITAAKSGDGVRLTNCGFSTIINCSVETASFNGIYLVNSNEIRIIANGVKNMGEHGIRIGGGVLNTIIGNQLSRNTRGGIYIASLAAEVIIVGNNIFWNSLGSTSYHGIQSASSDDLLISNNNLHENRGRAILLSHVDAARTRVMGNVITGAHLSPCISDSGTNSVITANSGHVTENSGTATVANTTTTIVVNHGLANTPTRVQVTARGWGNAAKAWVTTLTATQFTINVDADPGAATAVFDWRAWIGEG